jgi:hypothetical protein
VSERIQQIQKKGASKISFDHSPVVDFCVNAVAPPASKKAESAAVENFMVSFDGKAGFPGSNMERRALTRSVC